MDETNLFSVSIIESFEKPPEAFLCPPPLKYFLANLFTSILSFDRKEIFIIFSSLFSINITETQTPLIRKPKLTKPSVSPFL